VETIAGHKLAMVRERIAQLGKIENVLAVRVGRCHGNKGKFGAHSSRRWRAQRSDVPPRFS
jgi:hypothetical protein